MDKVGIIGNGFVGNAIYHGLKAHYHVLVYDKDQKKSINKFEEVDSLDLLFISVPTPMDRDGNFDLSIIKKAIKSLQSNKILVIKSTVTPDAATELIDSFPEQRFVFNPEFLTQRTAIEDFKNPTRIVLGGAKGDTDIVKKMYSKVFPNVKYIETDYRTACFIKYFSNCFYAIKVSAMNEFRQIADATGASWDTALDGLLSSGWVNPMHTRVPGPDGDYGFGGKCFPKDINSFISFCEKNEVDSTMLNAAWDKNLLVRKNKDWLSIEGAVTKENKNE